MLYAFKACAEFSVMQPFIYDSSSGCLMKWKLHCGPLMGASNENDGIKQFSRKGSQRNVHPSYSFTESDTGVWRRGPWSQPV